MYRLIISNPKLAASFYKDYSQYILDGVGYFLDGNSVDFTFQDEAKTTIKIGISQGSPTETFLRMIQNPKYLFHLMTCYPGELMVIIKFVYGLFQLEEEVLANSRLTCDLYHKYYPGNPPVIDHFNTIMHRIFVDWVFEKKDKQGKPLFNKKKFCQEAGVIICPYCGVEDITTSSVPTSKGEMVVKPDVDHFLPKYKYPYLAMSFANLIPTSVGCNRGRKRTIDPIVGLNPLQVKLQNPYLYDDSKLTFCYDFNNTNRSSGDAYRVRTTGNNNIRDGYVLMGLDRLYDTKRFLIGELYTQMAGLAQQYLNFLQNMGIPYSPERKIGRPDLCLVLGYDESEESARKHGCYKFRRDMAYQLINDSGCQWPW